MRLSDAPNFHVHFYSLGFNDSEEEKLLLAFLLAYLLTAHSAHSAYEKATGGRQRSPVSPCLSSRWVSDVSRKGKGQKGKTEEIFQLHQEGEQL